MIIQNNNVYSIGNVTGNYSQLPLGTYRLRYNKLRNEFYLLQIEDFKLPTKLYGDFSICNRIINTFNTFEKNLGVLLTGEKGSGKTVTAKKVCIESKLPVIIIDEYFENIELINFLADPSIGSCVILIDEFEKLYCKNCDDTIILQLLDGTSNSHHLYILTCNNTKYINEYLLNRPSRIYYRKEYDSIPDNIIHEIIDNELINKEFKTELFDVLSKFASITYDILMCFIKEINLYNESPLECAKLMNFVPDKVAISVIQYFKDGTCIEATDDSIIYPENENIDVRDYTKYHETKDLTDFMYINLKVKDLIKISRNKWEYKKDGLHYIIFKKSMKSLLF